MKVNEDKTSKLTVTGREEKMKLKVREEEVK